MDKKVLNKQNQDEIALYLIAVLGEYKNQGLDKYIAYEKSKQFINQYSMDNARYEYYIKFTVDMLELEETSE